MLQWFQKLRGRAAGVGWWSGVGGALALLLLVASNPDRSIAQDNRLQNTIRSVNLARLSDASDFSFALNAAANDTTNNFTPAKWTAVQMTVSGTTPNVVVRSECGIKFGSTFTFALCDTDTITATGEHIFQLNLPTSGRTRIVLDGQAGSGADVVVDSVRIGTNW